jgi:tetratricopeptide (TPR) repeat protein
MPDYIEGRLRYDLGRYEEALPVFEEAIATLARTEGQTIPELHYYAAETLVHLERLNEAEYHMLEELRLFPQNIRARGGLATLYHRTGRTDEAGEALDDLIRISPTPEAYALAARLWTTFGDSRKAFAVRAEAALSISGARQPSPTTQ